MSGSPLGVSLLSRILVPWAIILIALQSLQLKFLLILWVCVLVLISVQQISLKLSGSTLYQSLIISHSYYSQELRSHSAGWFSPRVSHKVAARWWLWLGSSQMLLYSHIWYLAWEDSNHWELGSQAPHYLSVTSPYDCCNRGASGYLDFLQVGSGLPRFTYPKREKEMQAETYDTVWGIKQLYFCHIL